MMNGKELERNAWRLQWAIFLYFYTPLYSEWPQLPPGRLKKDRVRCTGCRRKVLARNVTFFNPDGVNLQRGYYCPVCFYEVQKKQQEWLEKPCIRCGAIVERAGERKYPLCPTCKPTTAPIVKYYRKVAWHGAEGPEDLPFSFAEFAEFIEAQPKECHWCGLPFPTAYPRALHIDHVIPVSRGGKSTLDNLVLSCPLCNISKRDKLPDEWTRNHSKEDSAEFWAKHNEKVERGAAERRRARAEAREREIRQWQEEHAEELAQWEKELEEWEKEREKERVQLEKELAEQEERGWLQKLKIVDLNKLTIDELVQFRPDLVEAARMEARCASH